MRKLGTVVLVAVAALVVAGGAFAQTSSEIAVTRAEIQANRQAIVADNMQLTEQQAQAFWPLYREYRGELEKVGDRIVKVITDYGAAYESLTDAQASVLVKDYLAAMKDQVGIREKYAPRFEKVLPAKSVMRFYQIENKLDAIVMIDLVAQIPLAK